MALSDEIKALQDELTALNGAVTSIGESFKQNIEEKISNLSEESQKVANIFASDFSKAINRVNKDLDNQNKIVNKIRKGQDASKEIAKEAAKAEKEKEVILRKLELLEREGVKINKQQQALLESELEANQQRIEDLNRLNTLQIANKGITGNIFQTAKDYLTNLDKSGLSAKILGDELDGAQKFALAGEAALLAVVNASLKASDNINNLQKNLGVSYASAQGLQLQLALTADESEKLFITSQKLNESFVELTQQTGLIADFGGEALVTFTTLKNQLGLSAEEAGRLSLISRIQGKQTEEILENTVDTVGALVRQNRVGINAKAVLGDISNASAAITVSLGSNPELLAEAATEARLLGSNLAQVEAIAGSLLDFESSISAELEAELLLGQEINLEKARQAALNNDIATLSQEIASNEQIINSFATGNRIQQEAAAKALGLSRDELAKIALQQEINNLSAEEFKDTYGKVTYQNLQAQSASEKFASTLEKIQGIIGDIGTVFAPILDGFALLVGLLAQSKVGAAALVGVISALAVSSLISAIANIYKTFTFIPGGAGIPLAIAASAGLLATIGSAVSSIQSVQDGIAPSSNGPFTITDSYGNMAVTAKGDSIVASPNITNSASSASDNEQRRTNALLERLLAKDSNVYMDSDKVGTAFAKNASF